MTYRKELMQNVRELAIENGGLWMKRTLEAAGAEYIADLTDDQLRQITGSPPPVQRAAIEWRPWAHAAAVAAVAAVCDVLNVFSGWLPGILHAASAALP